MELQIGYFRARDDGARTRAACLNCLQTWLPVFYPEQPDLVARIEGLAASLGGSLKAPRLSWKYAWLQKAFGWPAATRAQISYNNLKSTYGRCLDNVLFRLERSQLAKNRSTANAATKP